MLPTHGPDSLVRSLATGCLALLAACSQPAPRGLVVLDPSVPDRPFYHDFGSLVFGERAEQIVRLSNTDSEPVTILSLFPACTCTRVRALRAFPPGGGVPVEGDPDRAEDILTVPSGGTLELVLSVNTNSVKPNTDKLAILRVRTTSQVTPFLTFESHLFAEKLFTLSPGDIRMGDVPTSHGGSGRVQVVVGYPDSPARILEVLETTGGIEAEVQDISAGGESRWSLTATIPPLCPLGQRHETVLLATTDGEGQGRDGRLTVEVWAKVVPDIVIRPNPIHLGLLGDDAPTETSAELRALVPGARVGLNAAQFLGDYADLLGCTFAPAGYVDDEGRCDRWTLTITAPNSLPSGRFGAQLSVTTDDGSLPQVDARVQGVVR